MSTACAKDEPADRLTIRIEFFKVSPGDRNARPLGIQKGKVGLNRNKFLTAAAFSYAVVALAHVGCIIFGGDWYRFFGAGEHMARMAENGHWYPSMVTSGIVVVLTLWSLYGLSGAGLIKRLPFLRFSLCLIAGIFLIRGVSFVSLMPMFPDNSLTFWLISSTICLIIGIFYAVGTYQRWPELGDGNA